MRKLLCVALLVGCSSPVEPPPPPPPVCIPSTYSSAYAEVVENTPTYVTVKLVCRSNGIPSVRWRIVEHDGADVQLWTEWAKFPIPNIRVDRAENDRILVWEVRDDASGDTTTSLYIVRP